MDIERISRGLNRASGGDPTEMLCARLWRHYPWICLPIDAAFYAIRREWRHCRNIARYERERRADPVTMLRLRGL